MGDPHTSPREPRANQALVGEQAIGTGRTVFEWLEGDFELIYTREG